MMAFTNLIHECATCSWDGDQVRSLRRLLTPLMWNTFDDAALFNHWHKMWYSLPCTHTHTHTHTPTHTHAHARTHTAPLGRRCLQQMHLLLLALSWTLSLMLNVTAGRAAEQERDAADSRQGSCRVDSQPERRGGKAAPQHCPYIACTSGHWPFQAFAYFWCYQPHLSMSYLCDTCMSKMSCKTSLQSHLIQHQFKWELLLKFIH